MILPRVILALCGRMPRTACEITVLPEPLSPTSATVWPVSTAKLTPRTASTRPSSARKSTARSSIWSSGALIHRPREPPRTARPRRTALPPDGWARTSSRRSRKRPAGLVHGQVVAQDADRLVGTEQRAQALERRRLADEQARAAPVDRVEVGVDLDERRARLRWPGRRPKVERPVKPQAVRRSAQPRVEPVPGRHQDRETGGAERVDQQRPPLARARR